MPKSNYNSENIPLDWSFIVCYSLDNLPEICTSSSSFLYAIRSTNELEHSTDMNRLQTIHTHTTFALALLASKRTEISLLI